MNSDNGRALGWRKYLGRVNAIIFLAREFNYSHYTVCPVYVDAVVDHAFLVGGDGCLLRSFGDLLANGGTPFDDCRRNRRTGTNAANDGSVTQDDAFTHRSKVFVPGIPRMLGNLLLCRYRRILVESALGLIYVVRSYLGRAGLTVKGRYPKDKFRPQVSGRFVQ